MLNKREELKDFIFDSISDLRWDIKTIESNIYAPVKYIDKVIEYRYKAICFSITSNRGYHEEITEVLYDLVHLLSIDNRDYTQSIKDVSTQIYLLIDKYNNEQ